MSALNVIMCSYGPRKATHKALRRMRAMLAPDDRLLVYAGTRMGVADPGKTKGVQVVEELGTDGLLAALDTIERPTDLVLHVTDGVTIPAGSLRKLLARARTTGKLAVPWTNDMGTDHYAGPLPIDGNIAPALTDTARRLPDDQVARVIRPVCIAGTRRQVAGLVPYHLSYPTTIMRLVYEDCIVAGGAVAAHDGSAESRLAPPEGPEGRPLLVASMIVRDEEDFLPDCLRSLEGLVDRIDLCDTGSTDRTIEIAREFGCNIIEREWRDDFGWARNEVLELASDAWYSLWIDADERAVFEDATQLRRQLATSVDHFDTFAVALTSPTEDGVADSTLGNWRTTRILSPAAMHYKGALHEQVLPRDGRTDFRTTTIEGLSLVHLGYTPAVIESRDKSARNLAIAEQMYRDEPDNPVAALQYARSMTLAQRPAKDRVAPLEAADAGYEDSDPRTKSFVKGLLAMTLAEVERNDDALRVAQESLDLVPAEDSSFRALLAVAERLDRPELVLERLDAYAHGPSLPPAISEPAMRAESRGEAVKVLLRAGEVDLALEHTREMIAEGLSSFPHWEELFGGLLQAYEPEPFVEEVRDLLTRATDGYWARPLAKKVRRDLVMALIDEYLEAGGGGLEPIRVGLTLAMLEGRADRLEQLARAHGDRLPHGDRAAMAARLRERGMEQAAEVLEPSTVKVQSVGDGKFQFKF